MIPVVVLVIKHWTALLLGCKHCVHDVMLSYRSREDTVRCIVSNLTDDGSNELLEELVKGQPLVDEGANHDEEEEDWEKWVPDPIDAEPGNYTVKPRFKTLPKIKTTPLLRPSF